MDTLRPSEIAAWHRRSVLVLVAVATLSLVSSMTTDEFSLAHLGLWLSGLAGSGITFGVVRRLRDRRWLLLWPMDILLLLAVSHVLTPRAAGLTGGLVTIAFLLVGLTQRRWTSLPLVIPALVLYIDMARVPPAQLTIRALLAVFIWICVAEIPAALAGNLRRARVELVGLAHTDDLTQLLNRRGWDERLQALAAASTGTGTPLAVLLLDMDHFKGYNDAHGHLRGDDLLRDMAAALRGLVRPGDLAARWGGEEFALALPGCGPSEAQAIAERVRGAVPGGQSCSIGVAAYQPGESIRNLVHRADVALYEAKRRGRNRVVPAQRTA